MTVRVDAGSILNGVTLTEVAAQNTSTITAPSTNPRIDRVVLNPSDGTVSVITGSEAVSPTAPAITSGRIPLCQISLTTSQTEIVNADIVDERPYYFAAASGEVASGFFSFTTTIADDAAYSFSAPNIATKPGASGFLMVAITEGGESNYFFGWARPATSGTVQINTIATGPSTNVVATTGELTGTTGTDTKMTISAHSDGKIYIENRRGGSFEFSVTLLNWS